MGNRYGAIDVQCAAAQTTTRPLRQNNANVRLAQDWQPTVNKKLMYIRQYVSKAGTLTNGNIWAKIYTAGVDPTAGSLVATSDLIDATSIAVTSYINFVFSTQPSLSASTQYFIVYEGDYTISSSNYLSFGSGTTSTYASGSAWIDNAGTWGAQTWDFNANIFTNADGGNFIIDSADIANTAALTTLKGGQAPVSSDSIYVNSGYRGNTIDGDSLACKIIVAGDGEASSAYAIGAVAAANKYGKWSFFGGCSVTFLGDATNTNSGIKMSPTTPDTTVSKGCELVFDMSNGKDIVMTNSVGSLNTSYRYGVNSIYGLIKTINGYNSAQGRAAQIQMSYTYSTPFIAVACDSTKLNPAVAGYGPNINNVVATAFGAASTFLFPLPAPAAGIDLKVDFRYNQYDSNNLATCGLLYGISTILATGGEIDASGCTDVATGSGAASYHSFCVFRPNGQTYLGGFKLSKANVRPTQIQPQGLTFVDLQDGTVKVTVSNIASYRTIASDGIEDYIQLYDGSGNARGGACSKTRYVAALDRKPVNCFIVAGVPLSAMTGWYAKATSDANTYSVASAAASTITPVLLPAAANIREGYGAGQLSAEIAGTLPQNKILTDAGGTFDVDAYEAARNVDPGIANVKLDTAYKIQNVDLVGTMSAGSLTVPATVTGVAVTNISSTKQRISWNMVAVTGGPAATYELSSNGSTADIATGIVGLNYLRTGLTASTLYNYYVRARNDAGASAWSAVVSETTDATRAIAANISRDLVTTAATITTANGYNTNVVAAEMERQVERNNGRLPMIEVCGPAVNITATKHSGGDMYELEYALVYKDNLNDDAVATSPVTVQTENVAADIIKAVMADHTRGGNAIITRPTDYFHTLDTTGPGMNMFTVVVTFVVETLVDYKNPYLIG